MSRRITVGIDLAGSTVDAGEMFVRDRGGRTSVTFRYREDYLARADAYALDPALPLHSGNHATLTGLPGAFTDCSPDGWGRNLISRRHRARATAVDATAVGAGRSLTDIDHLLGVSDLTRQGALRFRTSDDGPFLDPGITVPPLVELPRLLNAADVAASDVDDLAAIKELLDAGSGSLGGARPKASVREGSQLWIAKFPHLSDDWDVMAWEKTALDLADRAGLRTPRRRLVKVGGRSVLLLQRFDRQGGRRIGYLSAMSLVQTRDGDPADYLEVAETLTDHGSAVVADLGELWRRIAFSILVHNTDDHLRNHGLLRKDRGWQLAPIFDVNPDPDVQRHRVTAIDGVRERGEEIEALMHSAPVFGLSQEQARGVLVEAAGATLGWREVAAVNGITPREITQFVVAFDGLRQQVAAVGRAV